MTINQRKDTEHAILSSGAGCFLSFSVQGGFTFESVDNILKCTV